MPKLMAVILTYNEEKHIQGCLQTLQFADDCLVFDSYSTDDTVAMARAVGANVLQRKFDDYASQRNAALAAVSNQCDWVLFVDADERVTPALAEEIRHAIDDPEIVAWGIPRHNYLFRKLTLGAGWYPDYQTRLLRVGRVHYDASRKVHEIVVCDGPSDNLTNHLIHYNYRTVEQFIHKQRQYSSYDAQIMAEQGIRPKPQNYILQPLRQFRWRFLELGGYKEGWHGFRLSLLMGYYEFVKYLKLGKFVRTEQQKQTE